MSKALMAMKIANIISFILVFFGALTWFVIGVSGYNLVLGMCMGNATAAMVIYILVGVAALWLLISLLVSRGRIEMMERHSISDVKNDQHSHMH